MQCSAHLHTGHCGLYSWIMDCSGYLFINVIKFALPANIPWCSPWDQGLGLEAPRGQKWKSWSWITKSWSWSSLTWLTTSLYHSRFWSIGHQQTVWSWSWTFGLGLGLEEKVLQFFKTFVVILDGSDHLEKCHKDIYTLYTRKVESRQQGPPAKKAQLDEVLAGHLRLTWWLNVWKRKKKH